MRSWAPAVLLTLMVAACSTGSPSEPEDAVPDVGTTEVKTSDALLLEVEVTGPCGDGFCDKQNKEDCKTCPSDCDCTTECGDEICEDGEAGDESCFNCPADCGICCGDGECSADFQEDCTTCPADCECPGECGDGITQEAAGEECDDGNTMPDDGCSEECKLEVVCGDGECSDGETCELCPEDCEECPDCPSEVCDDNEDCFICPEDCGECECGDGECTDGAEDCDTCPEDCECPGECGDEACDPGETCDSCPEDCDPCCGNGLCEDEYFEDKDTCPEDCTLEPGCGDGILHADLDEQCDDGNLETGDGCDDECMVEPVAAEVGDLVITEIMKNPAAVTDDTGEWFEIYNTTGEDIDLNGWVLKDAGTDLHTIFDYDGVVVPGESYFVLARDGDFDSNGGVDADYVYYNQFKLSNKDDEVILSVNGTIIDQVFYDDGETFPGDIGKSLSLKPDILEAGGNDVGDAWCDATTTYGDGDFGTPGEANTSCEVVPDCGDGLCEDSDVENCNTCPEDCGACDSVCPNGDCEDDETFDTVESCFTCPADCGICCGDGSCDGDFAENCDNCPQDCPDCCGDGICAQDENCSLCPEDCDPCCGNGLCDFGETCVSCKQDCDPCCGNDVCEAQYDETCSTCTQDCGVCPACPDGLCNGDETCESCPGDCGVCPTEEFCTFSGNQGDTVKCSIKIARDALDSAKPQGFEFVFNFNHTKLTFANFSCMDGPDDVCADDKKLVAGHSLQQQAQGDGKIKVLTFIMSFDETPVSDAYMSGGNVEGEPLVMDIVFTLAADILPGQAEEITFADMSATDVDATSLAMDLVDGIFVVSEGGAGEICGNNNCGGDETCKSCPGDCGACCGNNQCDNGETCTSCPGDCGACCGNNDCDNGETCQSCPGDCGACCPDGQCNYGETCTTCPQDCDACPVCPDGQCNGNETCATCPQDCDACPACPDGECNGNETCESCPADCGDCPVELFCTFSGNQGATVKCPIKIARDASNSAKPQGFEFVFNFNAAKLTFANFSCMDGADDVCADDKKLVAGHSLQQQAQGDGMIKVLTFIMSFDETPVSDAYMSGGNVVGDPLVMDIVFTLATKIDAQQPEEVTFTNMSATDVWATSLAMTLLDGIFVISEN